MPQTLEEFIKSIEPQPSIRAVTTDPCGLCVDLDAFRSVVERCVHDPEDKKTCYALLKAYKRLKHV